MSPRRFSRALAAVVLVLAWQVQVPRIMADTCGIADGYFKGGKPPSRLRDPKCDACKDAMKNLQAAVDDCYAVQLAEAEKILNDPVKPPKSAQDRLGKQKADALTALGDPKDGGAQAIATQKANAAADAKEKTNKGKSAKNILKEKIEKLLKDLDDCEKNCPPPNEGGEKPVTPEQPKEPGGDTGMTEEKPPAFNVIIPPLPPCFDTERDRDAHRKKIEDLQKEVTELKKTYQLPLTDPKDAAWKEFKGKIKKALDEINDQIFPGDDGKDKVEKTPICKKGGGTPKKPGDKPKKAPRVRTGHNISYDDGGATDDFCNQIAEHKINVDTVGTGETIGHVADLVIENLTDQPIEVTVPPTVLESKSGKNQHYACPKGGGTVEIPPHEKKKVPMDGVCLARNKPPVGDGVHGDLAISDCDPTAKIGKDQADLMRRIAESKYDAADKLQKDGALKDLPYHDKKKQKDIVVQWSIWMDPRISEVTGAPPATKEDLKKVVYKQVEEQGPVTPEKKKKIDQGIDTIFEKIELTNEKAKDLEKPDPVARVELTGEEGKGGNNPPPLNVSDTAPTPSSAVPPATDATPTTQEKAPGEKPQKDEKPKDKTDKPETNDSGKNPPATTQEKKPKEKQHTPVEEAKDRLEEAERNQREAWLRFHTKSLNDPRMKQLSEKMHRTEEERRTEDWSEQYRKLVAEQNRLIQQIDDEFKTTPEGLDTGRKVRDAANEYYRLFYLDKQTEMEKLRVKEKEKPADGKTADEKPKTPDPKDQQKGSKGGAEPKP